MGGVEIFMVFGISAFCLVAGYLLGHVQRMLPLMEEQSRLARESRDLLKQLTMAPEQMASLPPGVYTQSEPDHITGLTKLVPLREDRRS